MTPPRTGRLCRFNVIDQVFADPQVPHLGMAVPMQHATRGEVPGVGQAIGLSRTPSVIDRPTPGPGGNTEEILGEPGYDNGAITDLRTRKVI